MTYPKKIVLASHNAKKTDEMRSILAPLAIELVGLRDFPGAPSPEETGATFQENAAIKALTALEFTGLPSLADDSGLVVDALGGDPGVMSARYAGAWAGDTENNLLLLKNLAGLPKERRRARFVSVIALAIPNEAPRFFSGETNGCILDKSRGEGGFGYDPLFLSDDLGMTFAEAPLEEKNRVSHRGRALAKLIAALKGL